MELIDDLLFRHFRKGGNPVQLLKCIGFSPVTQEFHCCLIPAFAEMPKWIARNDVVIPKIAFEIEHARHLRQDTHSEFNFPKRIL